MSNGVRVSQVVSQVSQISVSGAINLLRLWGSLYVFFISKTYDTIKKFNSFVKNGRQHQNFMIFRQNDKKTASSGAI